MLLIVLTHIIKYYPFIPGYQVLNDVFNVGLYIFLLVSTVLFIVFTIASAVLLSLITDAINKAIDIIKSKKELVK